MIIIQVEAGKKEKVCTVIEETLEEEKNVSTAGRGCLWLILQYL